MSNEKRKAVMNKEITNVDQSKDGSGDSKSLSAPIRKKRKRRMTMTSPCLWMKIAVRLLFLSLDHNG